MSGKDQSTAMASFNPRPARGPGATSPLTPPPVLLRQPVSILARPSGRALPPYGSAWLPEDAFQSSPGPWAGRYPRPRVVVASGDRVSILARPSGRALPHRTPASCLRPWALRVSILARPSGRALRRAWRASGCRGRCFNPRPALGPGATTPSSQMRSVWSRFQSSPGPRAGRYCAAGSQGCGSARFNPRPALGPGATSPACHPSSASRSGVSILARPSGRALRAARSVVACCAARFNPRPALGPGATQSEVGRNSRQLVVSILARPSGRALRVGGRARPARVGRGFNPRPALGPGATRRPSRCGSHDQKRFNPRPARGPGATGYGSTRLRYGRRFNPRPALGPGATSASAAGRLSTSCFNPRPALGPGATTVAPPCRSAAGCVSILARPSGRALQPTISMKRSTPTMFQSSPGPRAGRYVAGRRLPRQSRRSFNPRPALGPGATAQVVVRGGGHLRVSILARPSGRALLGGTAVLAQPRLVSILARPSGRALPLR